MRKLLTSFIFLVAFSTGLFSESLQDALKYLDKNTLTINITANVLGPGGACIWTTDISRITISGRSVKVKISGGNIFVITDITPYINDNDTILLVSQGEVWIGTSGSKTVNHYATIKSVPVKPGERAFFSLLG